MKSITGVICPSRNFFALTTAFILSVFILASCKKDNKPAPQPVIEKNLVISFGNGTIPVSQVDSADVVLKKQGSNTPIYRRFDKGAAGLNLLMDDTQSGNWTAEITIYTKKGTDNSSRMYTRSIGFTLPLASNLTVAGPTNDLQGNWKQHVVLASINNQVVVVVAADNADPYFDIRVKDSKWDYFYIERHAYNRIGNNNEPIAADAWDCYTSCYTHDKLIVNTTGFANYAEFMRNKVWNNSELFIIVADAESGNEETFYYTYDK